MSRLGNKAVQLPNGVEVTLGADKRVHVKGPKGTYTLNTSIPSVVTLEVKESNVILTRADDSKKTKQLHGLFRAMVQNAVVGVTVGFEKNLKIEGTGYRADKKGTQLDLRLGFSHPTSIEIPKDLQVEVQDNGTKISIKGIDVILVGKFASEVRSMKPPEPYKGKGIRYAAEVVKRKEGKKAKG
jgi:large subunit ribosomal protein L6